MASVQSGGVIIRCVHAIIITRISFQSSININKFPNAIFNNLLKIDVSTVIARSTERI